MDEKLGTDCSDCGVRYIGPTDPEDGFYQVESGDTVYAIATKYGITAMGLQQWNELTRPESLEVGQVREC